MKTIKTLLLTCAVLFVWQGNAQSPVTVFTGTSLPTDQGWQELKLDNTVNTVAAPTTQSIVNGVLKFTSVNAVNQFSQLAWYKTGLGLKLGTGYTIEIKAKVIKADKYGAFTIQGYDNEGKGFRIGIYDTYLAESTNPFAATNVLASGQTNSGDFHTYRLAVQPDGTAALYRDGISMGTFTVSDFYFDNIIENGGFEDGAADDNTTFPDFTTHAVMYRDNGVDSKTTGNWGLIVDNNDLAGLEADEEARIREIAVKPGTEYEYALSRHRINGEPWAWRDLGYFYDHQDGTQNGVDNRNPNVSWGSAYETNWLRHTAYFTPAVTDKTIRVEFPSWVRDGINTKNVIALDDVYFYENLGLTVGEPAASAVLTGLPLPADIDTRNLIYNGGFENHTINNDGTPYTWALADPENVDSNEPIAQNNLWNGEVRIQQIDKPGDLLDGQWAHSGTSSLRFSTLDQPKSIAFTVAVEAGKYYRYSFWHRNPTWPEGRRVAVKVGDNDIWSSILGGQTNSHNVWSNTDLVFSTGTATTVTLYTVDANGWYNIYFDDFALYEITAEEMGAFALDAALAGKTNLIANGDFEDVTIDNNGNAYTWALASAQSGQSYGDNYPVAYSDVWGTYVRLQDQAKGGDDDTGIQWAHSGTKSLRVSYLADKSAAQTFENITDGSDPQAWQTNINFEKVLEVNKTYTFVFWLKTSNYNDRGIVAIENGSRRIWEKQLSRTYNDWSRQSVTFTTTEMNHTLKIKTELTGWFNFYMDDLFLYEEETYVPYVGGDSYLFFGKSTGTREADVEIEYITVDNTGAYAPIGTAVENAVPVLNNLQVYAANKALVVTVSKPSVVSVYNTIGMLVANEKVENSKTFYLSAGAYLVKSVSENGEVHAAKAINK